MVVTIDKIKCLWYNVCSKGDKIITYGANWFFIIGIIAIWLVFGLSIWYIVGIVI